MGISEVTSVKNMTRDFANAVSNIPVSYGTDLTRVCEILKRVGDGIAEDPAFKPFILQPIQIGQQRAPFRLQVRGSQPIVQFFAQNQREEAAEHMPADRRVALVVDRPGLQQCLLGAERTGISTLPILLPQKALPRFPRPPAPHNAGASTGTYARGVEIFLRNLEGYLQGRPLENEAGPG